MADYFPGHISDPRVRWQAFIERESLDTNCLYLEIFLKLVGRLLENDAVRSLGTRSSVKPGSRSGAPSHPTPAYNVQTNEYPLTDKSISLETSDLNFPSASIDDAFSMSSNSVNTGCLVSPGQTLTSSPNSSGGTPAYGTSSVRTLPCGTCNKSFSNLRNFTKHMRSAKAHTANLHPCPNTPCQYAATTRDNLKAHVRRWCHHARRN